MSSNSAESPPATTRDPTESGAPHSADAATKPVKRRGGTACRRCRRLRSKCVKQNRQPPCEACLLAGTQAARACTFPRRGERDTDREFRRRVPMPTHFAHDDMGEGGVEDLAIICAASTAQDDDWVAQEESHIGEAVAGDLASFPLPKTPADTSCPNASPPSLSGFLSSSNPPLPPDNEVIEGCRTFVTSYFQLGFIPKAMFQENLVRNPASTSRFLLCCILSISSRFTPSLVHRYGSATTATDHFLKAARALAPEEMYRPSLDNTQAFFLLAIAEWGNGDRDRSSMDMGVAVRMATLLKLHREETYTLPPDADAEQLVLWL